MSNSNGQAAGSVSRRSLTAVDKSRLQSEAQKHIDSLIGKLSTDIKGYEDKIQKLKDTIPEFEAVDLFSIDPDSAALELVIAKIRLYTSFIEEAQVIQDSPYFLRLDVISKETGDAETIYISKNQHKDENIFSWVSPISTLRYAEVGPASYTRPNGTEKQMEILRKDNYIITEGHIVFMTYQDKDTDRQVVYQKHFAERRDFLLPEIVAELDKLQDQIIRSDPRGYFLISGPAGSGKTTLALHRIAYLVLTPEFKDFFNPERIVVFVSNDKDIKYFSNLLPELGIKNVRITTFMEWATMIANSRFRAKLNQRFEQQDLNKVLAYIAKNNPYPHLNPRIILDEYRRLKQQMIMPVRLREGSQKDVYPALHTLYTGSLDGVDLPLQHEFVAYLNFQKQNKFVDEIDLTIILMSLENAIEPFAHVVIDEVQNWIPEQLQIITSFAHYGYKSVTFIGDIQQKTKVYTINEWADISAEFSEAGPRKYELLKVYRNTKQILQYLKDKNYNVNLEGNTKDGPEVKELKVSFENTRAEVEKLIKQIESEAAERSEGSSDKPKVQIAVIGRFPSSIENLLGLGYAEVGESNIHVLTAEASQGLEFNTVIIVNSEEFYPNKQEINDTLGLYAANQYSAQAKYLFYVAATRAQNQLIVLENN